MDTTYTLLTEIARIDATLEGGSVTFDARDRMLLKRRSLQARLDAAQVRDAQRPHLRLIHGGDWQRTLGLDVA